MKRIILVVEDDDSIRLTLREFLEFEGYRVETAEDGEHALTLLATEPLPDLILTDLNMPKLDGWEFLERKNKDPLLSKIPVIVISANPSLKKLTGKMTAVISKPFNTDELIRAVRIAIG